MSSPKRSSRAAGWETAAIERVGRLLEPLVVAKRDRARLHAPRLGGLLCLLGGSPWAPPWPRGFAWLVDHANSSCVCDVTALNIKELRQTWSPWNERPRASRSVRSASPMDDRRSSSAYAAAHRSSVSSPNKRSAQHFQLDQCLSAKAMDKIIYSLTNSSHARESAQHLHP